MNRRNFFKTVTGFVAGVFAGTAKSSEKDLCGGLNGTLCPRCKFNEKGAKYSGTRLATTKEVQDASRTWMASKEDIKAFGSGDCGYLERMERLRIKAAEKAANPPIIINPVETWGASGKTYYVDEVNGDDKNDGLSWRTAKKNWVKILV